ETIVAVGAGAGCAHQIAAAIEADGYATLVVEIRGAKLRIVGTKPVLSEVVELGAAYGKVNGGLLGCAPLIVSGQVVAILAIRVIGGRPLVDAGDGGNVSIGCGIGAVAADRNAFRVDDAATRPCQRKLDPAGFVIAAGELG